MPRLLSMAILIGALYAADAFFFEGYYAAALWAGFKNQLQIIDVAAESAVDKLNR